MPNTGTIQTNNGPRVAAGWALGVLAASQLIIAIDYNIVYVALPSIGNDLGFSATSLQWVVSAYALTFGGFLLLGGRAADLLNRRAIFVGALVLYGIASLAGGLAEDQTLLIGARMAQGLGGALLFPATLAIINTTFGEGRPRNRALAIWGAAGASGGALGSLLGGVLTSTLGWRWTFFVNVPVVVVVIVLALVFLPANRTFDPAQAATPPARRSWHDYDLPGSVTVTVGALLLVFALVNGPQAGWTSTITLASFFGAAVFIAAFLLIETRTAHPLMPLRMFTNRSLSTSAVIAALFMAGFGGQFFLLTTWLQDAHGFTAIQAGLAFVPLALAIIAGTTIGARLVNRFSVRTAVVTGMVTGLASLVVLGIFLTADGSYLTHVLPWIVLSGVGQGITWTAMWIAASAGVPSHEQGIASGITSTSQQVGGAIGLAALVAIGALAAGTGAHTPETVNEGLRYAFIAAGALTGLGAVAAAVGLRVSPGR